MDHICIQEERLRGLETGQAETRIYVKQIKEDIQDIKNTIKTSKLQQQPQQVKEDSKAWQPVVFKLIEVIGMCITVLGAAKFIGK